MFGVFQLYQNHLVSTNRTACSQQLDKQHRKQGSPLQLPRGTEADAVAKPRKMPTEAAPIRTRISGRPAAVQTSLRLCWPSCWPICQKMFIQTWRIKKSHENESHGKCWAEEILSKAVYYFRSSYFPPGPVTVIGHLTHHESHAGVRCWDRTSETRRALLNGYAVQKYRGLAARIFLQ